MKCTLLHPCGATFTRTGGQFPRNSTKLGLKTILLISFRSTYQVPAYDGRTTTDHAAFHYNDVIMSAMASQITSLAIVYSIVYSGADKRKHQGSASLAFVRGIHRWPGNSPHKGPVTRKMFPFDDVIMTTGKRKVRISYICRERIDANLTVASREISKECRCKVYKESLFFHRFSFSIARPERFLYWSYWFPGATLLLTWDISNPGMDK